MFIKYGNYQNVFEEVEIPDSTFLITVQVISGDESVSVYYRDEEGILNCDCFDCGGRWHDVIDDEYYLDPTDEEMMAYWRKRTNTYDPFGEIFGEEEA